MKDSRLVQAVKNVLQFVLVLVLVTTAAVAQPTISYIIPDVGAPGMQVYVEFIAPTNANSTNRKLCDVDEVRVPSLGGYKIETVRPEDAWKLRFGPIVSSWEGRVVSTVVFIHAALTPNSDDWQQLTNEFKIPIRISTGSQTSNVDTFYIVKPFRFPSPGSTSTYILGSGPLGKRSRRGAMVVENMQLANATYTVNTNDCDPQTAGNQGYLPFTLLTTGSIQGIGSSTISVSAEGKHGGPGGGGGGGATADYTFSATDGEDGGNGFSGGARGGRKQTILNTKSYKNVGEGTGASGASLNGVASGTHEDQVESVGGGTGFPFGTSGTGCNSGGSCVLQGGFGAASGVKNNEVGASGAYRSTGARSDDLTPNGKVYGNFQLVPLAGGSGGSSGNPQATDGKSGSGGGGGGAIAVYAKNISQVGFRARGAVGSLGNSASTGGSGSGGAVLLSARNTLQNCNVTVEGDTSKYNGKISQSSIGRVRFDYGANDNSQISESEYRAATIDEYTEIQPKYTLTGKGNPGDSITVFWSDRVGVWNLLLGVRVGSNGVWSIPNQEYTGTEDTLLFAAVQHIINPATLPYRFEPAAVISGNSAIAVKVQAVATIEEIPDRFLPRFPCSSQFYQDTVLIKNIGSLPLNIDSLYWVGVTNQLNQFTIVKPSPRNNITIPAGGADTLIVRFTPSMGRIGVQTATLGIRSNDVSKPFTDVVYSIDVDSISVKVQENTQSVSSISFGRVCFGTNVPLQYVIRNTGRYDAHIQSIGVTDPTSFQVTPISAGTLLKSGDSIPITITALGASNQGSINRFLRISIQECGQSVEVSLLAKFTQTSLAKSGNENFGDVKILTTKSQQFKIRTTNNVAYYNDSIKVKAPFFIKSVQPNQPVPNNVVRKLNEELLIDVDFSPTVPGVYRDTIKIASKESSAEESCPAEITIYLEGRGTLSNLGSTKTEMSFGTLVSCETKSDTITFSNSGNIQFTLFAPPRITGPDASLFVVRKAPLADTVLMQGYTAQYIVQCVPQKTTITGTKSAFLEIDTLPENSSRGTMRIPLLADVLQFDVTPDSYSKILNPIVVGTAVNTGSIDVFNKSGVRVRLVAVRSKNNIVTNRNPVGVFINANNTIAQYTANLRVLATAEGDYEDFLTFVFDSPCVDSFTVRIAGRAVKDRLLYNSDSLHFGTVDPCDSSSTQLELGIASGVDATVNLTSMSIIGPDSAVFRVVGFAPIQVLVGSIQRYVLWFNPNGTTSGSKSASLVVNYLYNGVAKSDTIKLTGIRNLPFILSVDTLDFKDVTERTTDTKTFKITNTSTTSKNFTISLSKNGLGGIFATDQVTNQVFNIPGNRDQTIAVSFTPDTVKEYSDTIWINLQTRCSERLPVVLKGSGKQGAISTLWLESTGVAITSADSTAILLKGRIDSTRVQLVNGKLTAFVTYPADMFYPIGIKGQNASVGTRIEDFGKFNTNRLRTMKMTIDTVFLGSQDTVIATIYGKPLLGSILCDSLHLLDTSRWDNSGIKPRIKVERGAWYCLDVCSQGPDGERLLSSSSQLMLRVSPQPVGSDINVSLQPNQVGLYHLQLITPTGSTIQTFETRITKEKLSNVFTTTMSAKELSSGTYFLILQTPTERTSVPVIIVK